MKSIQDTERDTLRWRLRAEEFDGKPQVVVAPDRWQLDPLSVRQIAWAEGYAEVAAPHPAVLSFQCIRPDPNRWTHPPGHLYDHPPDQVAPAAEKRLRAKIQNRDRFWVSLRDIKLPRETVLRTAEACGMRLAWELGDETDQILLLAKSTIADPVAQPRRGSLRPSSGMLILVGAFVFAAVCLTGALLAYHDRQPAMLVLFPCALVGTTAILTFPRLLPRSKRASLLLRDFDGRPFRTVLTVWFGFTVKLLCQAGEIYGYRFRQEGNIGMLGTTITFQRTR